MAVGELRFSRVAIAGAVAGHPLDSSAFILKAGDTMTGPLVLPADPVSAMQAADKSDAVMVAISRDGKVYLGSDVILQEDLPPKVKDLLLNKLDKTVFVKSDGRALYGKVVDVVDNLRAAGVDQLGLLTEQLQ